MEHRPPALESLNDGFRVKSRDSGLPASHTLELQHRRLVQNGDIVGAGAAAWALEQEYPLKLEFALTLVHLYADMRSPKFEPAARRDVQQYISESSPVAHGPGRNSACSRSGQDPPCRAAVVDDLEYQRRSGDLPLEMALPARCGIGVGFAVVTAGIAVGSVASTWDKYSD
jgi:hypothetical protein